MDESDLILEFMKISKCSRADAISCLSAWGYDLKKALIDFNGNRGQWCSITAIANCAILSLFTDTSTQNYFKTKTKTSRVESDDDFPLHVNKSPMDLHHSKSPVVNHQDKDKLLAVVNYRPLLTKNDSIDLDCE